MNGESVSKSNRSTTTTNPLTLNKRKLNEVFAEFDSSIQTVDSPANCVIQLKDSSFSKRIGKWLTLIDNVHSQYDCSDSPDRLFV